MAESENTKETVETPTAEKSESVPHDVRDNPSAPGAKTESTRGTDSKAEAHYEQPPKFGKRFGNDADKLYESYQELEKEFQKRNKRMKELETIFESGKGAAPKQRTEYATQQQADNYPPDSGVLTDEEARIQDYLNSLIDMRVDERTRDLRMSEEARQLSDLQRIRGEFEKRHPGLDEDTWGEIVMQAQAFRPQPDIGYSGEPFEVAVEKAWILLNHESLKEEGKYEALAHVQQNASAATGKQPTGSVKPSSAEVAHIPPEKARVWKELGIPEERWSGLLQQSSEFQQ